MAFFVIHARKKIPYYLHTKISNRGTMWFFSPKEEGAVERMPEGFEMTYNSRTLQPLIRRKRRLFLKETFDG